MSRKPRSASSPQPPLRLMVSSSVFGNERLLDRVFNTLRGLGYEVWMSHRGTLPFDPNLDNFSNCLHAVDECDAFLGIITGRYGSGRDKGEDSITHREMQRAVQSGKLSYFLVHQHVVLARQLLRPFLMPAIQGPFFRDENGKLQPIRWPPKHAILDDLRILEMYEMALRLDVPLSERTGNWVQEFRDDEGALEFILAQMGDPLRLRRFLENRLSLNRTAPTTDSQTNDSQTNDSQEVK